MKERYQFKIAGQSVELNTDISDKIPNMLPGFGRFVSSDDNLEQLLQFDIESDNRVENVLLPDEKSKVIHSFSLEQDTCALRKQGKRYFFTIENPAGIKLIELAMDTGSPVVICSLNLSQDANNYILTNTNILKFSMWISTSFAGIPKQICTIHSSVIVFNEQAIMFLGESGSGKSTHTKLWLQHIPDSFILNDDSPVLCIEDGKPYVFGSPWSGKGKCYINERYPVAALVRLKQNPANKIDLLNKLESFGALYPSFPPAFLKDEYLEENICTIISKVIATTPVYKLLCLPDKDAAMLVWETVFRIK
jgi:hypothetical protein